MSDGKIYVCENDDDRRFGHTTFMIIRYSGKGPKLGCAHCWLKPKLQRDYSRAVRRKDY